MNLQIILIVSNYNVEMRICRNVLNTIVIVGWPFIRMILFWFKKSLLKEEASRIHKYEIYLKGFYLFKIISIIYTIFFRLVYIFNLVGDGK